MQYLPIRFSTMALGWDQALADAAIKLGIPFEAAVPFEGQESKWPVDSQRYYRRLLTRAEEVHIVSSGGFSVPKMQLRNEYMVDRADLVLALWNGSRSGTENAVIYARKVGKPVINLWSSWIKYK